MINKKIGLLAIAGLSLVGCKSVQNREVPVGIDNIVNIGAKKAVLSENEMNNWMHLDLAKDTIPGLSTEKAYKFLEGKKSINTIVAVLDSGLDIEHEDLMSITWVNEDEIAGNNIDDDKNGYIDDINGWNFLGGEGVDAPEQLEMTRIVAKYQSQFEGKTKEEVSEEDKENYDLYTELAGKIKERVEKAGFQSEFYTKMKQTFINSNDSIVKLLGKDKYSVEDLNAIDDTTLSDFMKEAKGKMMYVASNPEGLPAMLEQLDGAIEHYTNQKDSPNYDVNFKGRMTSDDVTNIDDKDYGNRFVIGSKEDESHGTHVAGIIAAVRGNDKGMNGVADNVSIMALRAVPDGDERDKDIALGIRYAVNNGAKVINMSFGKGYSPEQIWVTEAIKYAAAHDVLLVNAAGNDAADIDVTNSFPTDASKDFIEFSDNVLTIGALSFSNDDKLLASFSNYGKHNVDVFAPGHQIYSTIPNNEYKQMSGTSMAAPSVAGVAALIRSYYPKLSASQVKHIIMNSGTKMNIEILKPGSTEKVLLSDISVTGRIVNAYNAVVMADKIVNGKK
ncbi:MAG: S8 family serine peptidase [Flavobacteriaceae bacterium]|nr:S8 family serine peptidase [Flavobacteriaceae bacterium]